MISNIEKRDDMFNVGFIESKLFNKKQKYGLKIQLT